MFLNFGHYPTPSYYREADCLEDATRSAAEVYAAAHARVQALQNQRRGSPYFQPRAMRPAYTPYVPQRLPFEELLYNAWMEQARDDEQRRAYLARQHELERARAHALAVAQAAARREEYQRRREAQRMREQEALLQMLAMFLPGIASDMQQPVEPVVSQPVPTFDRKGKGKAVEVPTAAVLERTQVPIIAPPEPTLKEELEARIRNETDPDVQESLLLLYSDIFCDPQPTDSQPVAGPSGSKSDSHVAVEVPSATSPAAEPLVEPVPASVPAAQEPVAPVPEEPPLHRTPALPPAIAAKLLKFYRARRARRLSLTQIQEVESALRKLEEAFEFPEHLDFVNPPLTPIATPVEYEEPGPLAYTPNNTPVHAYENALNALLTRLDAVESNGDLDVRGRRKEIVKEVERALEAMERRVEESRERERERSRERAASVASEAPAVIDVDAAREEPASAEDASTAEHHNTVQSGSPDDTALALDDAEIPSTSEPDLETTIPTVPTSISASEGLPEAGSPESAVVVPNTADTTSDTLVSVDTEVFSPDVAAASVDVEDAVGLPEGSAGVTSEANDAMVEQVDVSLGLTTPTIDPGDAVLVSEAPLETAVLVSPAPELSAPEAISRVTSSTTDATFVTAESEETVPPSASDDAAFFTADPTPAPSSPTSEPMTRTPSTAAGDTFLLASTPLADEPEKHAGSEDELDIISQEELEAAKDSDWSDLDPESDA